MTTLNLPSALVTVEWLTQHIDHPKLVILDASAHMPGAERNAFAEWQKKRIKGAHFFDFNHTIADTDSPLPHMLPTPDIFTQAVRALGVDSDSTVVVYDSLGIFSAPRAWWMFTAMGHSNCAVLNGGLPAWEKQQGEIISTPPLSTDTTGNFVAHYQPQWVKDKEDILAASQSRSAIIMDARSTARFKGHAKEPREGLVSGHIPSSVNLPFTELLNDGMFKPVETLGTLLSDYYDASQPLYATCGSGITACIIAFAAHLTGVDNVAVYDGSWCEWGDPNNDLPFCTTP